MIGHYLLSRSSYDSFLPRDLSLVEEVCGQSVPYFQSSPEVQDYTMSVNGMKSQQA